MLGAQLVTTSLIMLVVLSRKTKKIKHYNFSVQIDTLHQNLHLSSRVPALRRRLASATAFVNPSTMPETNINSQISQPSSLVMRLFRNNGSDKCIDDANKKN